MASQSKSDASRANGAKSKGPVTAEGKARSSQNALKHGLTAQLKALPGESQEDFDALLDSHMTLYQPVGAVEEDLVQTLANTRWRLRRVPSLEFNILDNETIDCEDEIDEDFSEIDDSGRLGFVFRKLADKSKVLSLLIRYEASLTRTHDRVFKHLTALQKLRNEPKPVPPPNPQEDPASVSFEHQLQPMSSPTSTPEGRSEQGGGQSSLEDRQLRQRLIHGQSEMTRRGVREHTGSIAVSGLVGRAIQPAAAF